VKRYIALLVVIVTLSLCAAVPAIFKVRGQSKSNPVKFHRAADPELRVPNQYIVVLNGKKDVETEALRLSAVSARISLTARPIAGP